MRKHNGDASASSLRITHRDLTAPTLKAKPFNDPAWVWELKHDGYRALLIKAGERISLQTRKGNELLHFFPEIAADLRKLPDIAIDGELVMLNAEGKPEFHQLRGRCAMKDPQAYRCGGRREAPRRSLPSMCYSFAAKICARCRCSSERPRSRKN
jgi:hypothetical protein